MSQLDEASKLLADCDGITDEERAAIQHMLQKNERLAIMLWAAAEVPGYLPILCSDLVAKEKEEKTLETMMYILDNVETVLDEVAQELHALWSSISAPEWRAQLRDVGVSGGGCYLYVSDDKDIENLVSRLKSIRGLPVLRVIRDTPAQ